MHITSPLPAPCHSAFLICCSCRLQAGRTEGGDGSGGERFLDVAAILRGGSGEEAEQDDADLDALVV